MVALPGALLLAGILLAIALSVGLALVQSIVGMHGGTVRADLALLSRTNDLRELIEDELLLALPLLAHLFTLKVAVPMLALFVGIITLLRYDLGDLNNLFGEGIDLFRFEIEDPP